MTARSKSDRCFLPRPWLLVSLDWHLVVGLLRNLVSADEGLVLSKQAHWYLVLKQSDYQRGRPCSLVVRGLGGRGPAFVWAPSRPDVPPSTLAW